MKFLQKGFEYNFMARAIGKAFVAINSFDLKFNSGYNNDLDEFKQDLLILAYLCRKHILIPIEEYGWAMGTSISIPKISRGKITLLFAYQQTIGRLKSFAERISFNNEIQKILDDDGTYKIMNKITPDNIKFETAFQGKALVRYRYKLLIASFLKDDAEVTVEKPDHIVIESAKLILNISRTEDHVFVILGIHDVFKGIIRKEWKFDSNVDENTILLKIIGYNK